MEFTGLENKRILVVEDVELNQHLARHILESWGCFVEIAGNGALAVENFLEHDYDLILMDIQMPVMDGMEATRLIRAIKDERKASVPIVALTANVVDGKADRYIMAGMNDLLFKPFEEQALFSIVSKNIRTNTATIMISVPDAMSTHVDDKVFSGPGVYSLDMIESVSGGDPMFLQRMLTLFLEIVPPTLSALQDSLNSGQWLQLSKLAHKLKSTIDTMGITALKNDIRTIETNARAGVDLPGLRPLVSRVQEIMQAVLRQVKQDHGL